MNQMYYKRTNLQPVLPCHEAVTYIVYLNVVAMDLPVVATSDDSSKTVRVNRAPSEIKIKT